MGKTFSVFFCKDVIVLQRPVPPPRGRSILEQPHWILPHVCWHHITEMLVKNSTQSYSEIRTHFRGFVDRRATNNFWSLNRKRVKEHPPSSFPISLKGEIEFNDVFQLFGFSFYCLISYRSGFLLFRSGWAWLAFLPAVSPTSGHSLFVACLSCLSFFTSSLRLSGDFFSHQGLFFVSLSTGQFFSLSWFWFFRHRTNMGPVQLILWIRDLQPLTCLLQY